MGENNGDICMFKFVLQLYAFLLLATSSSGYLALLLEAMEVFKISGILGMEICYEMLRVPI